MEEPTWVTEWSPNPALTLQKESARTEFRVEEKTKYSFKADSSLKD